MFSLIEHLVKSLNKSTLTEDKELSCIGNMQIWLLIHIIVLIIVQILICAFVFLPISFFVTLFSSESADDGHDHNGNGWIVEDENQEIYSKIIRLLKQELVIIFVYVTAAFLHAWIDFTNINYTITYAMISRWFIEATLTPYVFFLSIFCLFDNPFEDYMDASQPYVFAIMVKGPLLIVMRYAEYEPYFILNDFESFLFYILCYLSAEDKVLVLEIFHVAGNHSFIRQ